MKRLLLLPALLWAGLGAAQTVNYRIEGSGLSDADGTYAVLTDADAW